MALIGLDIGTTGCKAHAFDDDLNLIASAHCEYEVDFPHPQWAEQDPEKVWALAKQCLRESVKKAGAHKSVKAIGLSVQGEAVTPVDEKGNALRAMILGMDTRTDEENRQLKDRFGTHELFQLTGMPVHTCNTLPKLLWLKKHEPSMWKAASRFLLYEDFFIQKFTGQALISQCLASRTQLFDLKNRYWSDQILDFLEINAEKLAEPKPSGFSAGEMKGDIAEELGLAARPLIAVGGHDQACGALGAGITRPGLAMVSTGTAEVVEVGLAKPTLNDEFYRGNMSVYQHTSPGMYVVMTLNQSGGFLLRWFRDEFCQPEMEKAEQESVDAYDLIMDGVETQPSSLMLLPHFSGSGTPFLDTRSKGAILGLTFATQKKDIAKAILEGLTMELRINLDILKNGGINISELRAIGGGAKSRLWLQMKADITGIPVAKPEVAEAAGMGAAILAGVAAGVFKDPASAIDSHLKIHQIFYPDSEMRSLYDDRFMTYKKLYPALKEINHLL